MTARFSCQTCGAVIEVEDSLVGSYVDCPSCGTSVSVPSGRARAAKPSAAPEGAAPPRPAASKLSVGQRAQAARDSGGLPEMSAPKPSEAPAPKSIIEKYLSTKKHAGLPGTVVLAACGVLGVLLVVVLILHFNKPRQQAVERHDLRISFSYDAGTDEIKVTNMDTVPWTGLVIQVQAGAATYSSSPADLAARQTLKLAAKELIAADKSAFDPFNPRTPPQSISFSATLPDDVKAAQSAQWPSSSAVPSESPVGK